MAIYRTLESIYSHEFITQKIMKTIHLSDFSYSKIYYQFIQIIIFLEKFENKRLNSS